MRMQNEHKNARKTHNVEVQANSIHLHSLMWLIFGEQTNAVYLESVLQRKIRLESYWCGCTFIRATNEQPAERFFVRFCGECWTSNFLAFASVPHALFAIVYRCGCPLMLHVDHPSECVTLRSSFPHLSLPSVVSLFLRQAYWCVSITKVVYPFMDSTRWHYIDITHRT